MSDTSWRFLTTSWRCHKDLLIRSVYFRWYFLKTSWTRIWRCLCKRKTSWRRLQNVLKTSWRRTVKAYIFVLIKTWRCLLKTKTKNVFKTSLPRRIFAGRIFNVLYKAVACNFAKTKDSMTDVFLWVLRNVLIKQLLMESGFQLGK